MKKKDKFRAILREFGSVGSDAGPSEECHLTRFMAGAASEYLSTPEKFLSDWDTHAIRRDSKNWYRRVCRLSVYVVPQGSGPKNRQGPKGFRVRCTERTPSNWVCRAEVPPSRSFSARDLCSMLRSCSGLKNACHSLENECRVLGIGFYRQ